MGKVSWEFDTHDPDDRVQIVQHEKSADMASALWDLSEDMRLYLKHHKDPDSQDAKTTKRWFKELLGHCEGRGFVPDEVVG